MKKSLIIFDLDGTLIDSVADLACALNQMLQTLNLSTVCVQQVRCWVGNGSFKLVERALLHHHLTDEQLLHTAHDLFLSAYGEQASKQTLAYWGVQEGLVQLQDAGYKLAIATNKPARFLPDLLQKFSWEQMFDCVVGGDNLTTKKPDPEPLLHICRLLDINTHQAIMVGDSKNDIIAGQAAKMMTLALRYGYNYGEPIDLSCPDAAFDDFDTLCKFLIQLRKQN